MSAPYPKARPSQPLAPLSRRRRAVLWPYLSFAVYAVLMIAAVLLGDGEKPQLLLRVLALAALVSTFLTGYTLLRPQALGLPQADAPNLDERQFSVLNRSQVGAYRIISFLFLLVTLYIAVASDFGWPLPTTTYLWQVLYFGVTLLVLTLPSAILAWTEADMPE